LNLEKDRLSMTNGYDLVLLSHHKCATNWLRSICQNLQNEKIFIVDVVGGKKPEPKKIVGEGIKHILLNVNAGGGARSSLLGDSARNIHMVRDPRDAFVSNYFSWRYSHPTTNPALAKFRENVEEMSVEEGMLSLVANFVMGDQLASWTRSMWDGVTQVRYEDLLMDFPGSFRSLFGPIGAEFDSELISRIRERTTFARLSGREDGSEDQTSHFRKGQAGDWQNYFTDRLSDAFFARYGWMGSRLGYW
jgi:Sulfotransferase domain